MSTHGEILVKREWQHPKADLKCCWWVQITAAWPRWTYTGKFFLQTKVEKMSLFCFTFRWLTPPSPTVTVWLWWILNKLTFSLADKYLSNPAKERQFPLTQLITSHLYVLCGWIISSRGRNNIPSHCKRSLCKCFYFVRGVSSWLWLCLLLLLSHLLYMPTIFQFQGLVNVCPFSNHFIN